jgi:hypothetical protein
MKKITFILCIALLLSVFAPAALAESYGSDTKKLFFLTGEQYNKFHGNRGGGEETMNPVEKAKAKGKDLLNKGKNLFKKKNKKNKEE